MINFDPSVHPQPYPANNNILPEEKVEENSEMIFHKTQQHARIDDGNQEPHLSQNIQENSPSI
jgi:hypothetical protein